NCFRGHYHGADFLGPAHQPVSRSTPQDADLFDHFASGAHSLYFFRVALLTTSENYQVLDATGYEQEPIFVESANIPGMKPAVLVHDLLGKIRSLIVALH